MNIDFKEIGLIASAGAIGGGISTIYAKVKGVPLVIELFPWGLAAYLVLGAIAAILGVYLVARTDTKQINPCLAFSIACGIFWAPIFEGASALVEKRKVQSIQAEVSKKLQETRVAIRQLPAATEQELPQRTAEVVKSVQELAAVSSDVNDPKLIKTIALSFGNANVALEEIRPKNPKLIDMAMNQVKEAQETADLGISPFRIQIYDPGRGQAFRQPKEKDRETKKRTLP